METKTETGNINKTVQSTLDITPVTLDISHSSAKEINLTPKAPEVTNGEVTQKKKVISYLRPPRNYEMPIGLATLLQLAAIQIIRNLPKGVTTFSTDDVFKKTHEMVLFPLTEELIREVYPMTSVRNFITGDDCCDDFYIVSETKEKIIFGIREDSPHFRPSPADSNREFVLGVFKNIKYIPEQLEDAKLILILPEDKNPVGARLNKNKEKVVYINPRKVPEALAWTNAHYQYSRNQMVQLLDGNERFNYGIVNKPYVVIDCDMYEEVKKHSPAIDDIIASTFTVKSGRDSSIGFHIYMYCDDAPKGDDNKGLKLNLGDPSGVENSFGDVRIHGNFFTVGPNSRHADTGKLYTVYTDLPIKKFAWSEIEEVIKPFIAKKKNNIDVHTMKRLTDVKVNSDDIPATPRSERPERLLNITCLDVLMPDNAVYLGDGEYAGAHPIHGSTTGNNLHVNKDVFYCFRHGKGGGLRKAIAVACQLVDCDDIYEPFSKDIEDEIDKIINDLDPVNYPAYKEARIAQWVARKKSEKQSRISALAEKLNGRKL